MLFTACKRTAEAVQPPIKSAPSVPSVVAPPPAERQQARDDTARVEQANAPVTGAFGFKLGEKCPAFLSRNLDGCLEAYQVLQNNAPFSSCLVFALDDGRVFRIWASIDALPGAPTQAIVESLIKSLTQKYGPPKTLEEPSLEYGSLASAKWQFGSTNTLTINVSGRYGTIEYTAIPQEFRKNGWKFDENLPHGRS